MDVILREEMGSDYSDAIADCIRDIQAELRSEKEQLARLVDCGKLTVVEFANKLNEEIVNASRQMWRWVTPELAQRLLGEFDSGLLDMSIAQAESKKQENNGVIV